MGELPPLHFRPDRGARPRTAWGWILAAVALVELCVAWRLATSAPAQPSPLPSSPAPSGSPLPSPSESPPPTPRPQPDVVRLRTRTTWLAEQRERLLDRIAEEGIRRHVVWRPVFRDSFDRKALGPHWRPRTGVWRIRDGTLVCTDMETDDVITCHAADLSGDIQVRYRCRTRESYNGRACDMSFMTCIPESYHRPVDGYLFRFGSNDNSWSGLSRSGGRRLARNRKVRIEPDKWHTVIVQRTGPWFSMVVDGDPVFLVKDPHPIENPRARAGGFYIYRSVVEIEECVISRPVAVGEAYAQRVRGEVADPKAFPTEKPNAPDEPVPEEGVF